MNEALVLIDIRRIASNPYQVRQAEDPAVVAELADNIKKNTLLQPPTVRPVKDAGLHKLGGDGCEYEIAFGHTRLAAFRLLAASDHDYNLIPCFVKDLDDLQMFEMAVAENIKRRDLNPIERANAMQTYMDKFKKTSAETGEFFGCDEATVRGTVRLLGLPELAREKLSGGEITVGAARSLLTLQRLATPEAMKQATEEIAGGKDAQRVVMDKLITEKTSYVLQNHYETREHDLAGDGLWRLDLEPGKFPEMPHLTSAVAQDAGAIGREAGKRKENIQGWINMLEDGLVAPEALEARGVPAETVEKLAHLVNPPACTRCSLYVQSNGTHVCGWRRCFERKAQAWGQKITEELSTKLMIPLYDPEKDGAEFIEMIDQYNNAQKEIFSKRSSPGLRLRVCGPKSWGIYPYTTSNLVMLVDVSPEAIKAKKDEETKNEEERSHWQERNAGENEDRERKSTMVNKSRAFLLSLAVPIFAVVLEAIKNDQILKALYESCQVYIDPDEHPELFDKNEDPIEGPEFSQARRRSLVEDMLENSFHVYNSSWYALQQDGPLAVAKYLQGLALEWDVTLPGNWLEQAQAYEEGPLEDPEDPEDPDEDVEEIDEVEAEE